MPAGTSVNSLRHGVSWEGNRLRNENVEEMTPEQLKQAYLRAKYVMFGLQRDADDLSDRMGWIGPIRAMTTPAFDAMRAAIAEAEANATAEFLAQATIAIVETAYEQEVFTLDDALERLGPVLYAVKTETHGEREAGEERSGKSHALGWPGRTRTRPRPPRVDIAQVGDKTRSALTSMAQEVSTSRPTRSCGAPSRRLAPPLH